MLPILMGASMWYLQKMSPTTITDPMQQKVMQFMPIIFTFMFLWFPAGLTLYWLVSNVISIIQQTIIYRQLEERPALTQLMRSPSFLMTKEAAFGPPFYYNVPTLLLIQPTSESSKMTTDTIVAQATAPAVAASA